MPPRVRPAVAQLPEYDPDEISDGSPDVRAHRNENVLGAPPHVVAALRALGPGDYAQYPGDRYARFLEALSRKLRVGVQRIAIGNGADDVLSALADVYLEEGDAMVVMHPTFSMYARNAIRRGANVRSVHYRTRWRVDAGDVLAACDARTRLLILGNPNNPTGDMLPADVLARLLDGLPDALVVVDEVYSDLTGRSFVELVQSRDNLAIVSSFSKVPALAGLRVGYVAGTPQTASAVRRVLAPHSINIAAVVAATAYLEGGGLTERFVRRYREQVARSLAAIAAACAPLAKSVYTGEANFVIAEFGARAPAVLRVLDRAGIRVRALAPDELDGGIRLTAQDDTATAKIVAALDGLSRAPSAWEAVNA